MGKSSYKWSHTARNITLVSGCMILASGCMILASATVRDIVGRLNIDGLVFIQMEPHCEKYNIGLLLYDIGLWLYDIGLCNCEGYC